MEDKYYHSKESVDEYISLSQGINGSNLILQLKDILPAGAKVLEIGSGPGSDYELLRETYDVVGSDLSEEFLTRLRQRFPDGEFAQLDASTLEVERTFDGIYANKVLHHLTDEELASSMQRQAELLAPGGIICLSFWKGEGSEVFKGMFVNYHSEEGIRSFLDGLFEVIILEEYEEFEAGDSLLLIARRAAEIR